MYRTLYLLVGAPGSGKSTWIKNNNLQDFTISSDQIRLLRNPPRNTPKGPQIVQDNEENWKLILSILELRMQSGAITFLDATNCSHNDKYHELARKYNYRIDYIDFSKVDLETCKRNNLTRLPYRIVPENTIQNFHFKAKKLINSVCKDRIIDPQISDCELERKVFFSETYRPEIETALIIGDVHANAEPLEKALEEHRNVDTFIFLGDLVDRGNKPLETLELINDLPGNKVFLIEGNHDNNLRLYYENKIYCQNYEITSEEFNEFTLPLLEDKRFSISDLTFLFTMSLGMILEIGKYKYHLTHGGADLSLPMYSSKDYISGTGGYKQSRAIAQDFENHTGENEYLVHGHRNIFNDSVQVNNRVYNLEGKVEFGGELRCLKVYKTKPPEIFTYESSYTCPRRKAYL